MEWPASFYDLMRGHGCVACAEGRPDETADGVRFFTGVLSDGYLRKPRIQRGLSVVVWRGRHVTEPTELAADEATAYWGEVLQVGRAIERAFEPVKINYTILGNSLPHLHAHIVPRYADDPAPGWPFPFPDPEPPPRTSADLAADLDLLRGEILDS